MTSEGGFYQDAGVDQEKEILPDQAIALHFEILYEYIL